MQNWDAFSLEPRFSAGALHDHLLNIEAYRLSLNKLHLPKAWQADLQRLYIVRAVHGTTAIEGNPLSEKEVSKQLSRKLPTRNQDQLHRQTENAAKAFQWVEENFKGERRFRLEDILHIHKVLTEGSDEHENTPGKLRESGHNVTVGSPQLGGVHHPPPGGPATKRLVEQFLSTINSRQFRSQNLVVQALLGHFYFVTIHPFGNGNGRTTRAIEAAILFGGGYNTYGFYSLSNYFYRNRDEYFRSLQAARTVHKYDLTAFLHFGLTGFSEELERINSYVRNRTHRLHYREMIRRCSELRIGKRRKVLNPREAEVLYGILNVSEPADPFSNEPAHEAVWADVWKLAKPLYKHKTGRTINRELSRLETEGFISISRDGPIENWLFRPRFEAIEEH